MAKGEPQKLSFTVPIFEPHPPQYYIRAVSDSWLHAEAFYTISFQNLQLPEVFISYCSHCINPFIFLLKDYIEILENFMQIAPAKLSQIKHCFLQARTSHTELLDLKPLPVTSLGNDTYEALYRFSHFNPIQTQVCFSYISSSFP